MNLLWPGFLLLLGALPLLVAGYVWMLRRRRRFAVRYSSLSLVRAALPRYSRLRRRRSSWSVIVRKKSCWMLARRCSTRGAPRGRHRRSIATLLYSPLRPGRR